MIVVTGATGFIGAHLLERLLKDGHRVRLLVRPAGHRQGAPNGPEIVWGDVQDPAAVGQALRGARLVYHLAARARAWSRDPAEFAAVNVQGTANVCAAAREHGVRRIVHVSTELVDGEETLYQRTKREAEQIVRDHVAQGGDGVIVRPTRVYGPGPLSQANTVTRVIALYRRGLFRLRIADAGVEANYVYVDDVVDGLLKAAERGRAGRAYVLGGENLSLRAFVDRIGEATGRRRTVLDVPQPIARAVAWLCEQAGRAGIEPMITRDWITILTTHRPASSDAAVNELGYRPRTAREGIAATVAWLEAGRPSPSTIFRPEWQSA